MPWISAAGLSIISYTTTYLKEKKLDIKINNESKVVNVKDCRTLKEVLELILEEAAPADSVLSHVVLNGLELTEEQQCHPEFVPVEDIRALEVFVTTAREISIESIKITSAQLLEVVVETKKTAEFFRYNDEAEANRRLVLLIEIFEKFVSLLDLLKRALDLDFDAITTEDKSLADLHLGMTSTLNNILRAQQNRDWISVADLLEFELAPILITWSRIIPTLACPTDGKPN